MIVFDISRLIERARYATPTGIERVELAYARHLIGAVQPVSFVAAAPWGGLAALPRPAVERFVTALAELWREGAARRRRWRARAAGLRLRFEGLRGRRVLKAQLRRTEDKPVYLLVSHHHLDRPRLFARLKQRHAMSFVCLIHDVIPIDFPEYARPGQDRRHRRRVETAAAIADALIVPSAATGAALRPFLARASRTPPVLAKPFGIEAAGPLADGAAWPKSPYFVCLGTIEPRKNHLLLLNLWRDLVAELGADAPRLVLIGRRGWEIENAIDMLDRCPALRGVVAECNQTSDSDAARLIKNARALLLPSYAEGFGFPLAEALALGAPVLASAIAALREIGGAVPEYFAANDGIAWRAAILDYAAEPSPRRMAQLERLASWRPPRWGDHFAAVETLLAGLA